jgi:hypothetical protein
MVTVIDTLDECINKDDIKVTLQLLPQVQMSKCVRLRFSLTSRPELPIRQGFKEIKRDLQNLDLRDVPMSEITRDISIFLRYTFSHIRQDHELSLDWPGDEVIEVLLTRTVLLFISAATLCRFINDANWDPSRPSPRNSYRPIYLRIQDGQYVFTSFKSTSHWSKRVGGPAVGSRI